MLTYDVPPLTSYEVVEVENIQEEYNELIEITYEENQETKRDEKKVKPLKEVKVTSGYTGKEKTRTYKYNGKYVTDHHYGIDVIDTTKSNKIYATADGKVVKVVNKGSKGGTMCLIRIQHKDYQSAYYHIASGSAKVKVGDYVKKGDYIADVGDTGKATAKHLHFQIDKGSNASAINPTAYVKGNKELEGLSKPSDKWDEGDYKLLKEKYLRKTPEVTTNNKVQYKNLNANAKAKCFQDKLGYARYKIGALINLKEFQTDKKNNVWGRTNTLWVCVEDKSGNQVEKV